MRQPDKRNTYGIIGLGRFGAALALRLSEAGKEVIVVDRDAENVRSLNGITDYCYVTDNLSQASLEDMGFAACDTVVVCIGSAVDMSILTTMSVLNLGVRRVIAKANSPEHGAVIERIGAEVVYPERDMAIRLASNLLSNRHFELTALSDNVEIMEMPVPKSFSGKKIMELPLRKKYGINIIAIECKGETEVEIDPQYVLNPDDRLIVIGKRDKLLNLNRSLV